MITTFGAIANVAYSASAHAEPFTVQTRSGLNVRSGPGLHHRIVGSLPSGAQIDSTGPSHDGWMPIDYRGRTGWVSAAYLTAVGAGNTPSTTAPDERESAYTTAKVHVRTGAGAKFRSVTVLDRGSEVETTGVTSNGYSQIVYDDELRWVSTRYLSLSEPEAPASEQPSVTATASDTADVPKPSTAALPETVGTRYATVSLALRGEPDPSSRSYGTAPAGASLDITGNESNGMAEIVWQGTVRWVTARHLSDTPPSNDRDTSADTSDTPPSTSDSGSSGTSKFNLPGLTPNAQHLLGQIEREFPEVNTIYGVREDPLPDHPSGRALDVMVYNDTDLGNRVANWTQENATELNVDYVIWNQRIWSVARQGEGWRYMADRGSATANHHDHVHITVR